MKEKEEQRCAECKSNSVYVNTHDQLCCSECGYVEDIERFYDIVTDEDVIPDIHPHSFEDYKERLEDN